MEKSATTPDRNPEYIPSDREDTDYFGAARVVEAERDYIRSRRGLKKEDPCPENLTGLALSGGGIRSASFSLGIMQALAYRGWLERIDYLSTVSGGGYIGSSITWILENDQRFGMGKENFPYASYPMSGEERRDEEREPLYERRDSVSALFRGNILRFLRQNAKYLTPGRGINIFTLVGVAFRGSILGLLVYGGLLTLILLASLHFGWFDHIVKYPAIPEPFSGNLFLLLTFVCLVIFGVSIFLYALGTIILSRSWLQRFAYPVRRTYERFAGYFLPFLLSLSILGILPPAHDAIVRYGAKPVAEKEQFNISGKCGADGTITFACENRRRSPMQPGETSSTPVDKDAETGMSAVLDRIKAEMKAVFAGIVAIVVGFASAVGAFVKTGRMKGGKLPLGLLVSLGVVALLFGMLIFGYSLAMAAAEIPFAILFAGAVTIVLLAFANINHLSLHRFYRDRLMETFLPNVTEVLEERYAKSHRSNRANTLPLHVMCARTVIDGKNARPGPYHIVNTNAVLVSSETPKFRSRGGDSFILSPAYCGSSATGWRSTENFMKGTMTLASAMAISGAALNPSAGCGGKGITRSPFLSVLMGLLNFRLGYWVPNPGERTDWRGVRVPNSFLPGLSEVAFRGFLNESSTFVQLSDGGHFENLALYELVRRKLKLIIVCDGGADPDCTFSDLANAMEKVRSDFGALIMIDSSDLQDLIPKDGKKKDGDPCREGYAERPYLKAKIKYADNSEGRLIYITTTFFRRLTADLYGYRKENPAFPDEPTGDQFFDEKQFEAYRELGFQAAWTMMGDYGITSDPIISNCGMT